MGKFMGHESPQEFARAIQKEHERMGAAERRAAEEREQRDALRVSPVKFAVDGPMRETFSYSGEPGSKERLEQVRSLAPEMAEDFDRERRVKELSLLMRDPNPSPKAIQDIAQHVLDIDSPELYAAVRGELRPEALQAVDAIVLSGVQAQFDQHAQAEREQIEAADEERREVLREELERIPATDQEEVVGAIPDLTEMDPELARLSMRTVAEVSRSHREALGNFNLVSAMSREFKRTGAPGSHMNDSEREKWERAVDEAIVETYERSLVPPELAAMVAEDSIEAERGPSPGLQQLQAELHKQTYEGQPEHLSEERDRERAPDKYAPSASHDSVTTKVPTRTGPTSFES